MIINLLSLFLLQVSKNILPAVNHSNNLSDILLDVLITGLYYGEGLNPTVSLLLKSIIRNLPESSIRSVSTILEGKLVTSERIADQIDMNGVELVYALLSSKFGEQVIVECCNPVFGHFINRLTKLIDECDENQSATEVTHIFAAIHIVVRTLLAIFKYEAVDSSRHSNQFVNLALAIYNLESCPPEVQINCLGVVLFMGRQEGADERILLPFVQKITNSDESSSGDLLRGLENSCKTQLNICLALLSNLKIDQITLTHDHSHGSLVGGIILPVLLHSKSR